MDIKTEIPVFIYDEEGASHSARQREFAAPRGAMGQYNRVDKLDPSHRLLSRCACLLSLFFLAGALRATAQGYPPYPPPGYPGGPPPPPPQRGPDYPPPGYPNAPGPQKRQPNYPPQYPDYRHATPYPSFYGMFSLGHYSGQGVGVGTGPTQSGGITALGGTFGGYVTYPTYSPIAVGVDARLIVENSSNSTPYGNKILGGLVGLRIDGSNAGLPIDPYFQFEIGGVGTNSGTSRTRTASFAYQAQFGADFPLGSPQLSARMEYGTGQLTSINNTNHTLQTFSFGLVLHVR
jgi:hypothetical protein